MAQVILIRSASPMKFRVTHQYTSRSHIVTRNDDETWECECAGTPPSWIWRPSQPGTPNTQLECVHIWSAYSYYLKTNAAKQQLKEAVARKVAERRALEAATVRPPEENVVPEKPKRRIKFEDQ